VSDHPVPALIIAGWLGAGKTTLVDHLLTQARAEGVKLAIISNEFGDTGIDRALLDAGEEGFVELDGGCVCCRLSDALGQTLRTILEQVKPDRLVLECSGVALPGEILVQFWTPPIDELVTDEVVVVVVDAETASSDSPLDATLVQQLEAADLVLLNKRDLVDAPALQRARDRVTETTGGQPVLVAERCRVDPALLFPPDPAHRRKARRTEERDHDHDHDHERFTTLELSIPDGTSSDEVLALVQRHAPIRAKGFVRTPDGVRLVQGVGPRVELTPPPRPVPDTLVGTVVLIHREQR